MDNMHVYIVNLRKYVEGINAGAWFSLPIDFEELKEKIGLDDNCKEYAIHDFELPFEISEYTSIEELNHIYELVEELEEKGIPVEDIKEIKKSFSNFEKMAEKVDDIICYPGLSDMTEVAEYIIEETGALNSMSENLRMYFDYESLGRDLYINDNFVIGNHGIYKII